MSKVTLKTITNVSVINNLIDIYTYFTESTAFIIAFIKDVVDNVNGVSFIEGEEGFTISEYPDVTFYINNNGELITTSNDDKNFYLNSDGELIFEITE